MSSSPASPKMTSEPVSPPPAAVWAAAAPAEDAAGAGLAVDEVVAALAVQLVGAPDVGRRAARDVPRAARRVVEQLDRADDDRLRLAVVVVDELQEGAPADEPEDVRVVARDRVRVRRVAGDRVVARHARARAAVDDVGAVRTVGRRAGR